MRWSQLVRDMALFIVFTTIFMGSVIAITGTGDAGDIFLDTLAYVVCCTLTICPGLLLISRWARRLPRLSLVLLFAAWVEVGAYWGGLLATYFLWGRWAWWAEGIGVSLASQ